MITSFAKYTDAHKGFYVDVFPYDVYPVNTKSQKWQGKRLEVLKRLILAKTGYTPWNAHSNTRALLIRRIIYIPFQLLSKPIPKKVLVKHYERICMAFNDFKSGFVFEQAGASNYGKWVIPEDCIDSLVELLFEDDYFPCPHNWDRYLSSVYGDYMKLPPENERENRHKIIEISFPESEDKQ